LKRPPCVAVVVRASILRSRNWHMRHLDATDFTPNILMRLSWHWGRFGAEDILAPTINRDDLTPGMT